MSATDQTRARLATAGIMLVGAQRTIDNVRVDDGLLNTVSVAMESMTEMQIDQAARDHVAALDAEAEG